MQSKAGIEDAVNELLWLHQVKMMDRMGRLSVGSRDRVFRAVVHTKEGERLRKSGGLSYSRMRELLLEKISQLGYVKDSVEKRCQSLRI